MKKFSKDSYETDEALNELIQGSGVIVFSNVFSFRITVALGIDEMSEIDEAFIPLFALCFKFIIKKSP